ncbi:MAG: aminotransferase class V-fold PLP-dependent enzyme [Ktedonobacteraceae bacterium]|nr:aminotransferase class V-fold PLP-dependent enzyme [Ktedonobacteraceae bacterium]
MSDLTHVQRIRQEMPATTSHLYLNTGTFGPLPRCVTQAIQERLQREWSEGRLGPASFETMESIYGDARRRSAQLLNADTQEIALTDNTGEGMNSISYGLNWREGDEVITTNQEHISALAPLYQIRERFGVVLRIADLGPLGERPAEEAIAALITPRTRLIVLSHVSFQTGTVLNVSAVTRLGRAAGIPVLVDGAQSAGAIPVDVKALDVDFYAIPMQKWLCGPDGTGALYVNSASQHYVRATYVGYFSMKHEEGIEWELHQHAQCFELGGRHSAALAGQSAGLAWLEETVGHPWLFERIASLNVHAAEVLKAVPGVTILTPQPGASGLLAFTLEGHDPEEVVNRVREEHNIYIRSIHEMHSLRISTGFYNTQEEIETLAQALRKL